MSTSSNTQSTPLASRTDAAAPVVWPTFHCRDTAALIDFLVQVLGFERTTVHTDGDAVVHAELRWPEGGGIMLGPARDTGPWQREPGSGGTYIVTDHVDAIHARCTAAGARIVLELTDTDYGSHTFAVADPEGNLWSFGTYAG
ncbi:VOC family protein [Nesterenkonia ebinurensis]|uniref:VOC family protein n=1 Tax=Nesterenkonia ebinurensis TaxID=2608252 RepID=UPI00123D6730|nr:VOC family protein [Nesterenkonia ebinurensis]